MEANECEASHLDSDVHLPPRKRLLAGLNRQNSESTWQGSASPSEYSARLHKLLKSYKNGFRHMSPEEIAEAARSAAVATAKAADAARASAEEKASVAVKAVSAAKDAMSLAARFSMVAGVMERQSRKNKLKSNGFPNAMVVGDEKAPCAVVDLAVGSNGEAELGNSTKKLLESSDDMNLNGRKRGRNESFRSLKDSKPLSSAEAHMVLKFRSSCRKG